MVSGEELKKSKQMIIVRELRIMRNWSPVEGVLRRMDENPEIPNVSDGIHLEEDADNQEKR